MGVTLSFGGVRVTETVIAYQRKRLADHEQIDLVALDSPQTSFTTQALWYELPDELLGDSVPLEVLLGSLHAAEHSQIAVLPLLAMCDRWDIGGLSTNLHPQTGRPTIFIYDGHPGGIGITRRGFRAFDVLVGDAHRLVSECPCKRRLPVAACSRPKCGNLNEPLHKAGATELMGGCSACDVAQRTSVSESGRAKRRYTGGLIPVSTCWVMRMWLPESSRNAASMP